MFICKLSSIANDKGYYDIIFHIMIQVIVITWVGVFYASSGLVNTNRIWHDYPCFQLIYIDIAWVICLLLKVFWNSYDHSRSVPLSNLVLYCITSKTADHSRSVPLFKLVSHYITTKTAATAGCWARWSRMSIICTCMWVLCYKYFQCQIGFVTWVALLISPTHDNTNKYIVMLYSAMNLHTHVLCNNVQFMTFNSLWSFVQSIATCINCHCEIGL